MKEFILCAAVWYNDGLRHDGQPENITEGIVVCGRRHHNCYATLKALGITNDDYKTMFSIMSESEHRKHQGFLTSKDRYVDRREAWEIAKENNQIKFGLSNSDMKLPNGLQSIDNDDFLISENLY